MYETINSTERLHVNDASIKYTDKCIMMLYDDHDHDFGTVECIGDDEDELLNLKLRSTNPFSYNIVRGVDFEKRRVEQLIQWRRSCTYN
jgi:hypothetical protein